VVALLLLLTTGGSWWWRTRPRRLQPPAAEMTAQPVVSVVTQRPALFAASAPDPKSDPGWWLQYSQAVRELRMAVQTAETVDIHGERAVARVVVYTEHGEPAYRQTRFYRYTDAGWLRTEPDATLWGPERSLETPYFVYHFRQNDAQAVIAVAPQMDALYTKMRRNFVLPITSGAEKLPIVVSVLQPPGHALSWFSMPDRIIVPSPAIYLAPVELTDADLLAQSLALALSKQVLAQSGQHHAIGGSWQPLLDSLHLWQVWDLELPLAGWREEVVTWLYTTLYITGSRQPPVLPGRYTDLCAAHKFWLPSPMQMHIPLMCAEVDLEHEYLSL
jgi:hypothetical protein